MFLKLLLAILCLPSAGILLMKIYGIMEMDKAAKLLLLPSLFIFFVIWLFLAIRRQRLSKLILVGFIGGLIGTIGYDLIRVPFMLLGNSVFVPIRMYGVWLTGAPANDSFTDLVGWLYHFSNGITFGIAYALLMKNRAVFWAILYALLLETVFVLSPFGELFGLTKKPLALFFAYLGHVAYGYPLGWYLRNFDSTLASLRFFRKPVIAFFTLTIGATIVLFYTSCRSRKKITGPVHVQDKLIKPTLIRINKGESISFQNTGSGQQQLRIPLMDTSILLNGGEKREMVFSKPGIFQLLIENNVRARPAFVICEPVQKFK